MHDKTHKKIKNILGTAVSLHVTQERNKQANYKNINASLLSLIKIIAKNDDVDVVAFAVIDHSFKEESLDNRNLLLDLLPKGEQATDWEERKRLHIDNLKTEIAHKVLPITSAANLNNMEILADCFKRAVDPIYIKSDKKVIPVRQGWRWLPSKVVRTDWYHQGVTKVVHDEDDIAFVMLSTMVLTPKSAPLASSLDKHQSYSVSKILYS